MKWWSEESLENLRKKLVEHQAAQAHTQASGLYRDRLVHITVPSLALRSGQEFHPGLISQLPMVRQLLLQPTGRCLLSVGGGLMAGP